MPKSKAEPGRSWWMSDAGYKSYLQSKPPKQPSARARKKAEEAALKAYRAKHPEWAAAADALDAAREKFEASDAYWAFNAERTPEARAVLQASQAQVEYDKAFHAYLTATSIASGGPAPSKPPEVTTPQASPESEARAQTRRKAFHVVRSK